jgi:ABC-type lipoprotein release transport system permease subunit
VISLKSGKINRISLKADDMNQAAEYLKTKRIHAGEIEKVEMTSWPRLKTQMERDLPWQYDLGHNLA